MAMMIDNEGKIIQLVGRELSDRFGGSLDFGPITLEEKLDQDGDPYLHIFIVFDGDQSHLDPAWTSGLMGRIRPQLMDLGVETLPSKSFIEKSEWMALGR